MLKVATRVPATAGLNVIDTVQLTDAARLVAHVLLEIEKSAALVPEMDTLVMVIEDVPPFLREAVWATAVEPTLIEPKVSDVGLTVTVPGTTPVPDSATDCGLLLAESVKRSVAVRVPAALGLNTTLAVQLPEAARLVPHVLLEIVKSAAFVPEIATLLIVIDVVSLLLKVTDCPTLLEPTVTAANVRLVGLAETLAEGAVPFPDSATVWVPAESLKFNVAVRAPVVVGAKAILAVQLAAAASVAPQVLL
jgi:hypothetical protein